LKFYLENEISIFHLKVSYLIKKAANSKRETSLINLSVELEYSNIHEYIDFYEKPSLA